MPHLATLKRENGWLFTTKAGLYGPKTRSSQLPPRAAGIQTAAMNRLSAHAISDFTAPPVSWPNRELPASRKSAAHTQRGPPVPLRSQWPVLPGVSAATQTRASSGIGG
jgi:hypothetical protein